MRRTREFVLGLCILSIAPVFVCGYMRKPCTRTVRPQFQFEDCYVPPLDTSLPLSSASFLLSHDTATGYIKKGSISPGGVTSSYTKNQIGTAYDQLNNGARALDLRPRYLANGTVTFHHGGVPIGISLERLLADTVRWCAENDDELVLLLSSNLAYASGLTYEDVTDGSDYGNAAISAMSTAFAKFDVPYLHCRDLYNLTVGEALDIGALPTGGYVLALDNQDYYAGFCGKQNWIEDEIVTCYPGNTGDKSTGKCTDGKNSQPFSDLKEYIRASANNEPTDNSRTLGPPKSLYYYPFNEIQAFWQVDSHSAIMGISHLSTILQDNKRSGINAELVEMIHQGQFDAISLFAVDNVELNGNALLSVMRTSCGQSTYLKICGDEIALPRITYVPISKLLIALTMFLYVGVFLRNFVRSRGGIDKMFDSRINCQF